MRYTLRLLPLLLVLSGCAGPQADVTAGRKYAGVPASARLVGGGPMIQFTAPAAGVLYLVDGRNYQLVMTKSVAVNEQFEINLDEPEARVQWMKIVQTLSNPDPRMYFLPNEQILAPVLTTK